MTLRFNYEILNRRGTVFLRSARPRTLDEIKADQTLCYMLRQYRHRAITASGQELEHLPDFPQPD
jgi:hypothetical protein